jgi:1-acyl-sn-glycerol-3-phosphate acyltransferase
LIDRDDRRSQLKTFKEGIKWLKQGVPIMAFPEGQRSKDGHLMDFKGGLFLLAAKTKVPIVPITLSHTHSVMPGNALFPVQRGAGKLHVHVHDAIDTDGKTEEEMVALVRASFLKTLPLEQHPLELMPSTEELQAMTDEKRKSAQKEETKEEAPTPA